MTPWTATTRTTSLTNDYTALAVDANSADVRALVASDAFAAGTGSSTQHTFAFDNDGHRMDMDEADEVAGTYNGAMGMYRCNGSSDVHGDGRRGRRGHGH